MISLFDYQHTLASGFLAKYKFPWLALKDLKQFLYDLGASLPKEEYQEIKEGVWVHKEATIYLTAYLGAPCIIGKGTEVRHGAFIRGSALVGENCVVGNSVELKNCILFDSVQVPHYNYVGASILGYKAHMGAGSINSNVKGDKSTVVLKFDEPIDTKMKKFGAMVGDFVEVGCNSVLNPGTIIGRNSQIYPLSSVRGVIDENCIYKSKENIVKKR